MAGTGSDAVARRASGRPQAAQPWQPPFSGLQQNWQQIASNLARLQQTLCRQLSQFQPAAQPVPAVPVASMSRAAAAGASVGSRQISGGVSREEVGRATWTFLHTLAAQYPERPTGQQQRDARELIDILTRMYPCGECARHFKEVVAASPPAVASRKDFSRWMCEAHNAVNRRLGKPAFNCTLVEARWAGIECGEEVDGGGSACSLEVGRRR